MEKSWAHICRLETWGGGEQKNEGKKKKKDAWKYHQGGPQF